MPRSILKEACPGKRWIDEEDDCAGSRQSFGQDSQFDSQRSLHHSTREGSRHSFRTAMRLNRSSWSLGLDALAQRTSWRLREIRTPEAAVLGSRSHLSSQYTDRGSGIELTSIGKCDGNRIETPRFELQEEQVDWDHCVQNPQNWPARKKWKVVWIASWLSFITPLASSMVTPALPSLAQDLQVRSKAVTALVVSLYLLGFGISGTISAPLSELYGRLPLYHTSNICFAVLTLSCGFAPNIAIVLALRILAGSLGTACMVIGGGTCADVFPPQQRAQAVAVWASGTFLGSCIGPVLGGVVVEAKSWRWIFYILGMVAGANVILCAVFMPETSVVVIKRRQGVPTGKQENEPATPRRPALAALRSLARPFELLFFSPVVLIMAVYSAVAHAVLYLLFTSIPFTFSPRYDFSPRTTGLIYLAPGLGMLFGASTAGQLSDRIVKRTKARGDKYTPEKRLDPALILAGSLAMVTGLLLYGWSIEYHVHWISALAGLFLFGFGVVLTSACGQTYVVECYLIYAASVSAAFSLLIAILSGVLPVTGFDIFSSLGMGWGNVLLAGIIAASASTFAACRVKGCYLRQRFTVDL